VTVETRRLTDEQRRKYREDGYLVLDAVVDDELIELVERAAAEALEESRVVSRVTGGDVLQKVPGLTRSNDVFRRLATDPAIAGVVEELLGEEPLIFRDVLVVKPAREGAALDWHQDSAYWDVDPPALVSAWVALADVPEEAGCLHVLAGSHAERIEHDLPFGKGRLPRPLTRLLRRVVSLAGTGDNPEGTGGNRFVTAAKAFVLGTATRFVPFLGRLGDYSVDRKRVDELRRDEVSLPVDRGSVIFFHSLLLHASGPNRTDRARIAPIISYMGRSYRFTGRGEGDFISVRA
jgi:ectoine hydroxylase-related dioxygenase (phytanoyl-CoA dioxygenase family)